MPEDKVERTDQTITCVDCGATFVFTAQEQLSFEKKGYQPPKRCYPCRVKRREERQSYRR